MVNKGAELQKQKGNEHFMAGRHAEAIECYTFATEMDPNNHIYFTNRSNAYFQMKKYDKSLRDALKSIKLNPSWEKGFFRAGMAQMELEQFTEAQQNFKKACELKPEDKKFKAELLKAKAAMMKGMSASEIVKLEGNEAFKLGQIDDAIEKYTMAIETAKPGVDDNCKADAYANRAACYRQQYEPEKCIKDCTAALAINPYHIKALIRRGQSYEQMEKFKDALKDFELVNQKQFGVDVAVKGASRIRKSLKAVGQM